jgi:hypothetical protein
MGNTANDKRRSADILPVALPGMTAVCCHMAPADEYSQK